MATTMFTAKDVQELRQRTSAGMMDCKKALEETGGNMDKAIELLRKKGIAKADKRLGKEASEGVVTSYVHHNGRIGVLVEVNCETDFVARTVDFRDLAKSVAEHIAGASPSPIGVSRDFVPADVIERERRIFTEQAAQTGKPANIAQKMVEGRVEKFYKEVTLLDQPWIRDGDKTIGDLIKETSAKVGENVVVRRFARFKIGEE